MSSARGRSEESAAERTGRTGRPATVRERASAYVSDALVVIGVLLVLTRNWPRARRLLALGVGSLVGATGYHVMLEGRRGQTVGKRLVGITVVTADGEPCGYRAAVIRTAARVVDWLPGGYALGLLSIRVTERRQRVGDIAAGTVVVTS